MNYSFILGQPVPSLGVSGLYRLVHTDAPVFSCFMCLPDVVPRALAKIPQLMALGADDMRHLDGWVFFNFKIHDPVLQGPLMESKIISLLSRASLLYDMAMGYDVMESPRPELNCVQEDELNPSYDVHLGIFEDNERTLNQAIKAGFPDGWEKGWAYSGVADNGIISLCLHIDTGYALRARFLGRPYFDESNLRIALTAEQRSRLTAQGQMFHSMQMGKMAMVMRSGRRQVVSPVEVPPPMPPAYLCNAQLPPMPRSESPKFPPRLADGAESA